MYELFKENCYILYIWTSLYWTFWRFPIYRPEFYSNFLILSPKYTYVSHAIVYCIPEYLCIELFGIFPVIGRNFTHFFFIHGPNYTRVSLAVLFLYAGGGVCKIIGLDSSPGS